MPVKRDALVGKNCKTCAKFHNPEGAPTGFCVARPPTVFMMMVPVPPPHALLNPSKPTPPMQMQRVLDAKVPPVGEDDGCWEHTPTSEY